MNTTDQKLLVFIRLTLLALCCLAGTVAGAATVPDAGQGQGDHRQAALPVEYLKVQGLHRSARFYRPARPAAHPALLLVLHGSGGDGERIRRMTGFSFDRLADAQGLVVAYPDALGGQWHDCRAGAPYHGALKGVDDSAFLRAVTERARDMTGGELGDVYAIGYSNGGHLVFRLALETPGDFAAFAVIGAHLPVPGENDCRASGRPVSIMMVSGTADPINPWAGGAVRLPGGGTPGRVRSATGTAGYFRELAGMSREAEVVPLPDRDPRDGTRVEMRRWSGEAGNEVALMVVRGGGHSLPDPAAAFPAAIVGRTSRDVSGAAEIWRFFSRHSTPGRVTTAD